MVEPKEMVESELGGADAGTRVDGVDEGVKGEGGRTVGMGVEAEQAEIGGEKGNQEVSGGLGVGGGRIAGVAFGG